MCVYTLYINLEISLRNIILDRNSYFLLFYICIVIFFKIAYIHFIIYNGAIKTPLYWGKNKGKLH